MAKNLPARSCPTCGARRVKKNGTTTAGTTRYRCLECGASHTGKRPASSRVHTFEAFAAYVLGKLSTTELHRSSRMSTYREFRWCWDVPIPTPLSDGQVHEQVFIDGTYLHGGWVLLIACTHTHILNWQLAAHENASAYKALLAPIAPPLMVVTDGAQGAMKAIEQLWTHTSIQRCLVHIQRNNRKDLTLNPKTNAGRILSELSTRLTRLNDHDAINKWLNDLNAFYQVYRHYLKERTYAASLPPEQRKPGKTWWYTHERDRRVYFRLKRLLKSGELFAYMQKPSHYHRTTNIVEHHNSAIKDLLNKHRGWQTRQQTQAAHWYLNAHTQTPLTPRQILTLWDQAGRPTYQLIPPTPTHSPQPNTHLNEHAPWEDGLSIRKGWAGHHTP